MPASDSDGLIAPNDATVVSTKGGAATGLGFEQADMKRMVVAAQSRRATSLADLSPME
jgi:hypothetical protein